MATVLGAIAGKAHAKISNPRPKTLARCGPCVFGHPTTRSPFHPLISSLTRPPRLDPLLIDRQASPPLIHNNAIRDYRHGRALSIKDPRNLL